LLVCIQRSMCTDVMRGGCVEVQATLHIAGICRDKRACE
jgi:hypothetical protein